MRFSETEIYKIYQNFLKQTSDKGVAMGLTHTYVSQPISAKDLSENFGHELALSLKHVFENSTFNIAQC